MAEVKFMDLSSQQDAIYADVERAIKKVLKHGQYVMGPEVEELEAELARFCGAKHVISCANGTDAIKLILMAKGVNQKSAVFVPSFTFAATAGAVKHLGAQPIFVDVLKESFNMDPDSLRNAIKVAEEHNLIPTAVIAVDIFGQPANYAEILKVAQEHGIWVLCDSAQSFGASYQNKKVGVMGLATSTSFFPSKPLGCYGDGGCMFTDDEDLSNILRSIRVHGQGKHRYDNVRVGINSRLDTIQAAILLEKLKIFPAELERRQKIASEYSRRLKDFVSVPHIIPGAESAWALYTVVLNDHHNRDLIQAKLNTHGIPSVVYYSKPLHQQKAYEQCLRTSDGLKTCEMLSKRVLSLPMHPYLDLSDEYLDKIVSVLRSDS